MPLGIGLASSGRRPRLIVLVACVLTGLVAAACSPNDDPITIASTTTVTPEATTSSTIGTATTGPATTRPASTVTTIQPAPVPVPTFVDENGFDDHTVPVVETVGQLMALSRSGVGGQSSMKFTIPQFDRPADAPDLARAHLMDGNFYSLHDEWYYYRLLNDQPVAGTDVSPVPGQRFASVEEIYRWANLVPAAELPLDLTFIGQRLYASGFYDLALHGDPRSFGAGAIVRFPDPMAGRPDHWLIELEYADTVTPQIVAQFFSRVSLVLPDEVSSQLEWVVRSPQHEDVALQMESSSCRTTTASCTTAIWCHLAPWRCTARVSRPGGCCMSAKAVLNSATQRPATSSSPSTYPTGCRLPAQ